MSFDISSALSAMPLFCVYKRNISECKYWDKIADTQAFTSLVFSVLIGLESFNISGGVCDMVPQDLR